MATVIQKGKHSLTTIHHGVSPTVDANMFLAEGAVMYDAIDLLPWYCIPANNALLRTRREYHPANGNKN